MPSLLKRQCLFRKRNAIWERGIDCQERSNVFWYRGDACQEKDNAFGKTGIEFGCKGAKKAIPLAKKVRPLEKNYKPSVAQGLAFDLSGTSFHFKQKPSKYKCKCFDIHT